MSKRSAEPPNDSQADMEGGMTTAERRRRRRRGGSLRVPSDNVPRSRTPTAPPAPRPEDPALAMSIAYSFASDASGPVPRQHEPNEKGDSRPTVADPQNGEPTDFETKTREMTAVDLEALGLVDPGTTLRTERVSSPGLPLPRSEARAPERISESDLEVVIDTNEQPSIGEDSRGGRAQRQSDSDIQITMDGEEAAPRPVSPSNSRRLATVALSEEDLEEVRAATAPQAPVVTFRPQPSSSPPPTKPTTKPPPLAVARTSSTPPSPVPIAPVDSGKTQQLQAVDIEVIAQGTLSSPEIDLSELALRAESSGEIEVDVDDALDARPDTKADGKPAEKAAKDAKPDANGKSDSIAVKPDGEVGPPKVPRAPTAPILGTVDRKALDGIAPPPPPIAHAAPPPTPAVAKQPHPPTPPPPMVAKKPDKPDRSERPDKPSASRGKPWFVDLFDEDYLRTLPFLTPQATQAEAEFVSDTLNLTPGAQVLDVGCGYGRHAMELAARGFHVVGLDLSTSLLLRGGEEAARRGLTINFIRGDMRELDFENQFDGAYCLFSTFGYFDDETNKKTLQNVARALKPNGKIVIEILNRDYVIADLPTRVWWEGEGCVVLEEVELNYFSSRIQVNRSVVFDDGRQLEQEISVRAYSLHEVGKLMHAAGFRVLEVSGGYQMRGRFFGNQSRHIIVLAERKDTGS